jgi:hypothetical protein
MGARRGDEAYGKTGGTRFRRAPGQTCRSSSLPSPARYLFCYECHELLLHNPVLLPDDVHRFAELVRQRGLSEESKPHSAALIAERIKLFREVIANGLTALLQDHSQLR